MKRPTASNVEAFVMCGASHILPQSDKHNDYAYRGSEGHAPLAAKANGRIPTTTVRGHEMVRAFPFKEFTKGVTNLRGEAAFAVNVKERTSRLIGIDIGRQYGALSRYEVPCTIDIDGLKGSRGWIRDWKFGVTSSWWQLLVQCMAIAYSSPDDPIAEIDAGFVYIDGETGGEEYTEDARIVSLDEIDEAADKVVAAWNKVEGIEVTNLPPSTTEGPWCQYCGAFPHCPSKWNLAREILGSAVTRDQMSAMTQEEQGLLWSKLQERRKLIESQLDVLKISAAVQPLPLPNGKQLVMMRMKGHERIDKKEALRVLKELGAGDDDYAAVIKKSADYVQAKEIKR